jgi:hypothetical protein
LAGTLGLGTSSSAPIGSSVPPPSLNASTKSYERMNFKEEELSDIQKFFEGVGIPSQRAEKYVLLCMTNGIEKALIQVDDGSMWTDCSETD